MEAICYDHSKNLHSRSGAVAAMEKLLSVQRFGSLLDVGAGTGSWLAAAQNHGVSDVAGIEGIEVDDSLLCVPSDLIEIMDLREPFRLGRKFDAAICLEVAEHLPESSAQPLIDSICAHADLVFFSAAAPSQGGDNHVNCQAPSYWQEKFNQCGFVCSDEVRRDIWTDAAIPPWYRQNLFVARRDPAAAGREPRIRHLLHPDMIPFMDFSDSPQGCRLVQIESGRAGVRYYLNLLRKSLRLRVKRII